MLPETIAIVLELIRSPTAPRFGLSGIGRLPGPGPLCCAWVIELEKAAASTAAAFSSSITHAQQRGPGPGSRPIPDKPNLGAVGDRINSNTIAIVSGNINATYLTIAY